jgi:hypothetical protein
MIEKVLDVLLTTVLAPMLVFVAGFSVFAAIVLLPMQLYTDAECLRNGYPVARVTIGLERYCATLDGAVTVKIQHLQGALK